MQAGVRLMKKPTIGILAGMGPRSTAPFIDMVVSECQSQYGARDDIDFPKMMICSQPAPFYEDRPIDHDALEAAIRSGLQHLERAGADLLAIACNTAHIYYERLAASVNIPLLNMVELGIAAISESARRVALMAARPTVESGIYQAGLRRRGLAVVEPDWQSSVDDLLGETRNAAGNSAVRRQWDGLLRQAESAGADTIVVACLDLSGMIARIDGAERLVDTAQSLAREIVRQWLLRRESRIEECAKLGATDVAVWQREEDAGTGGRIG
jgi:aspartate racemase